MDTGGALGTGPASLPLDGESLTGCEFRPVGRDTDVDLLISAGLFTDEERERLPLRASSLFLLLTGMMGLLVLFWRDRVDYVC